MVLNKYINFKRFYFASMHKEIISHINKILGRTFSIFESAGGTYCVGPIYEKEPQIILKIDNKSGSGDLCGLQPNTIKVGKSFVHTYKIPATEIVKQRQVILKIYNQTGSAPEEIAPALIYDKRDLSITPQIARQIFIAEMEEEFLKNASENNSDLSNSDSGPYAKLVKFFRDSPRKAFDFKLTAEDIINWNLASLDPAAKTWIKNYKALAPQAIAGIRETQDVKHLWNPNYTTNTLGILLTAWALAEIASRVENKNFSNLDLVTGGEVRYNTELSINLVSRLWAGLGITVHRPKKNIKTTVWAAAFITAIKSWGGGIYFTASHSGRNIFCGKLLSSDGSQFIVEQVMDMINNIEKKLLNVLATGQPLTLYFAADDDKNIREDIDNPEHDQFVDLMGYYADYLRKGVVTENLVKDAGLAAQNGLKIGYCLMHGCMGDNLPHLFDKFGFNKVIEYHNFQKDSYFGGIGVDDYNEVLWSAQKYAPLKNIVVEYVKKYVKSENFADKPIGYNIKGSINTKELCRLIAKKLPPDTPPELTIKLKVDADNYDNRLLFSQKKMTYLPIAGTNKVLIFYAAKFFDLSQDLSWLEVLKTTGFDYSLRDKPVGYIEMTTDPDGDRLVIFQVEENTAKNKKFLQNLGVTYMYMSEEKILAAYSPNQSFLMTMDYRQRQLVKSGLWEKYGWFIITTTLSASSWLEWAAGQRDRKFLIKYKGSNDWQEERGVPAISVPVGIKEIATIERKVEAFIKKNEDNGKDEDVLIHDIYGNHINLGRKPAALFIGEQSGAMMFGAGELIRSLNGARGFIAMHDKSAGEASVAVLGLIAELYNQKQSFLSKELARIYKKHSVKRKNDVLINNTLYDPTAPIREQKKQKELGAEMRDRNNAFYLSLAFAFADKIITLKDAKQILREAFPELDFSDLTNIIFVGDGTYFDFKSKFVEIRPSGTDAKIRGASCGQDKEEMTKFCDLMCKFDPQAANALINIYKKKLPAEYQNISKTLEKLSKDYNKYLKRDLI